MQISGAVNGNNVWKKVGKGVELAGKMAAGGAAGLVIGGIGLPAALIKDGVRGACCDAVNLVTGRKDDSRFISMMKLVRDGVLVPAAAVTLGVVLGMFAGSTGTAANTYDVGLKEAVKYSFTSAKREFSRKEKI